MRIGIKHGKKITIAGKDYEENPENKLTLTMLGAFAGIAQTAARVGSPPR